MRGTLIVCINIVGAATISRTRVEEFPQPALLLQRHDQRRRADAEEQRRSERRAQADDIEHVRVLVEPLADRPLVVVTAVGVFTLSLRDLRYVRTKILASFV